MKKIFLIISAITLIGCQPDLTGHWHAESNDYNLTHISFDILENNDCYLTHSLNGIPTKGEHKTSERTLAIPSDCGVFWFKYELKNNKLHLTNELGTKFIAEKITKNCSRFKDFASLLNIDFLKINNTRKLYNPIDSISLESLNGFINIDYSEKNDLLRLEFMSSINSIDQIDSLMEYIQESYADIDIPHINYIITPSKKLKIKDLEILIYKIDPENKKNIFVRTLKPIPNKWDVFEYIKISDIDFNLKGSLKDIIY